MNDVCMKTTEFEKSSVYNLMGCNPSKSQQSGHSMRDASVKANSNVVDETSRQRRTGISAQAITAQEIKDWKKPVHEKADETKQMISKIIRNNAKLQVLFGHLDTERLDEVILAMFPREVSAGETIILQGDNGDAFWIVESGQFDIFVNRKHKSTTSDLGDKVASCEEGACFGELALMYNAPRAATVVAKSKGKLWGLDSTSFKMMLVTSENSRKKKYESFLEKVSILHELNAYERANLSDVIDVARFGPGEVIMRQGEKGNNFYILESGDAKAFISTEGSPEVLAKHYTRAGDYFGELALILATPRKATVYAGENGCVLLFVSKEKFDRVLGPIKHRLKIAQYPEYAEILEKAMHDEDPLSPASSG
jgi:cAMP-dependent protein kinase regulator